MSCFNTAWPRYERCVCLNQVVQRIYVLSVACIFRFADQPANLVIRSHNRLFLLSCIKCWISISCHVVKLSLAHSTSSMLRSVHHVIRVKDCCLVTKLSAWICFIKLEVCTRAMCERQCNDSCCYIDVDLLTVIRITMDGCLILWHMHAWCTAFKLNGTMANTATVATVVLLPWYVTIQGI